MGISSADVSSHYNIAYYKRKFRELTDMPPYTGHAKRYLNSNEEIREEIDIPNFEENFDGRCRTHWAVLVLTIEWARGNMFKAKLLGTKRKIDEASRILEQLRHEHVPFREELLKVETAMDKVNYDVTEIMNGLFDKVNTTAVNHSLKC